MRSILNVICPPLCGCNISSKKAGTSGFPVKSYHLLMSIDFCCSKIKKKCCSKWSVWRAGLAVSATVSQRNQHQARQEEALNPKPELSPETVICCGKTGPLLSESSSSLCLRSGDVQRAIPPRLDGVLPLRQRHAHQEPERLGDAQRGQSRQPERVDVAEPSPGPGWNRENLTSSRA